MQVVPGQGWKGEGSGYRPSFFPSTPHSPDPIDQRRLLSSEPQAHQLCQPPAPFHLRLDNFQGRSWDRQ